MVALLQYLFRGMVCSNGGLISPEGGHGATSESPQGAGGAMVHQLLQKGSLVLGGQDVHAPIWQPRHHEPLSLICNTLCELRAVLGCEGVYHELGLKHRECISWAI